MSDKLQNVLDEIKLEKDTYLLPENIKKDVQIFDVVGTLEGASTDVPVKLFHSQEKMTEDLNNLGEVGDLSILYNTEYNNVQSGEIVNTVVFPETVIFSEAISTTITGEFVCIGEEEWNYTVTLTPTSYISSRTYMTETIMVEYTSEDGITYTRVTELKDNETLLQADEDAKDNDLAVVYDGSFQGMYKYEHRLRTELWSAYINPRIEDSTFVYDELTYIDFTKLKQVTAILKSSTDLTTNSYNRYLIIPKSDTIYWCYCSFVVSNSYWDEAAIYNDGTTRYITGSYLGDDGTKFRKVVVDLSTETFELSEITATTYNYQYMCETFDATDVITDIWVDNDTGQFYVYGTNSGTTNSNSNKKLVSGLENPTIPMYYLVDYTDTITPTEYTEALNTVDEILGEEV